MEDMDEGTVYSVLSRALATVRRTSPIVRSTSSEEEGTSSRAGPSTTSVQPKSSMSAVTGRNVRDKSNVTPAGSDMDAWTVPKGSTSQVVSAKKQKPPETQLNDNPKRPNEKSSVPRLMPTMPKLSYTYTYLKDVKVTPKVNIFGVVKFFKPPYKSNGPDCCMTVTLIDPTLDDNNPGLVCQLFQNEIHKLPQIHAIGDIVCFHGLKITEFGGKLQGQKGESGFHCLVFDGDLTEAVEPRASTSNFTLTDKDKKRVEALRLWSTKGILQLVLDNHCCTLDRCYPSQYFDLICQVISVAVVLTESCVVVKVWDGTKIRGHTRVMDISKATAVDKKQSLVDKSEGLSVDVSLYDNHVKCRELLTPGQFIKICNIHAVTWREGPGLKDSPCVELVLHRGTSYGRGVLFLQEKQVSNMIKRMDEAARNFKMSNRRGATAIQTKSRPTATTNHSTAGTTSLPPRTTEREARTGTPNISIQQSASVINYHSQPKTTCLRDVIKSESPNKLHIRAKVADYLPNNTIDYVHLRCSECKFRCRVPPTNTNQIESIPTSGKRNAEKEAFDQRQETSARESDGSTDSGGSPWVQKKVRFTNPERSVGVMTRSQHSKETGDSSSEESLKVIARRRQLKARKRLASENKHPARSTQRENLAEASTSTKESEKRRTVTTSHGVTITAEMPSSGDDEGGVEGSEKRKKNGVEIGKRTVPQALQLNRTGMTLVNHADLPIGLNKGVRDPAPGDQVYYICPKCVPTDADYLVKGVPGDSFLLQYWYCMKLILEDGTGSIEVIVDGKEGETFFKGIPVANLHTSPKTKLMLEETMTKLCPFPIRQVSDSSDEDANMAIGDHLTHPWLECCILSTVGHVGRKEVVKYSIFETSLNLDVE